MKFWAIAAVFAAFFVLAQANEEEIKKAIHHAHKVLDKLELEAKEINREHHGHLLPLSDYYKELAQTWLNVLENKTPVPMIWNEDQQKIIEASLSYTEDRAMEEMKTVKHYIKHNQHFTGDVKHLVKHANESIQKGNAVLEELKRSPQTKWSEIGDLTVIIHMLSTANSQLAQLPEGTDMRKSIEKVECLEQSLHKTLHHHGHREFFF